jgi:hypothetical protein
MKAAHRPNPGPIEIDVPKRPTETKNSDAPPRKSNDPMSMPKPPCGRKSATIEDIMKMMIPTTIIATRRTISSGSRESAAKTELGSDDSVFGSVTSPWNISRGLMPTLSVTNP